MRTLLIVDDNVELASLLAVVAEVHGFTPRVAHTGQDALAALDESLPDAALVDLLLPDMQGQDLLETCQERGVVTFAMSGVFRGEGFARTAETFGARAHFEKPFAARDAMLALVAVLDQLRPEQAGRPSPMTSEADAEPSLSLDDGPTLPVSMPPLEAMVQDSESAATTGIFAQPTPPPLPRPFPLEAPAEPPAPPPEPTPDSWAEAVPEEAVPEEIDVVPEPDPEPFPDAAPPPPPSPASPTAPELGVVLRPEEHAVWRAPTPLPMRSPAAASVAPETPVPLDTGVFARLLVELARRRASGEVRVRRGEVLKVIGLTAGKIHFAASNLGSERLPRFAARAGRLPADRAPDLQAEQRKGVRTGDALVALGIIDEATRAELIAQLVREIVWSVLDATDGEAQFVTRVAARKGLIPLALSPLPLVVEGYRRTFSLVRLRALVEYEKRYLQALEPVCAVEDLALTPGERQLFTAADGSKTVEDLILLSELEEREALAALVALTQLGVLEARAQSGRRVVLV